MVHKLDHLTLEPPAPATVSMAAVHRIEDALIMHRVVPRYRPLTSEATCELSAVSSPQRVLTKETPTTLRDTVELSAVRRFCFLCGAPVPPWRESCFVHDLRSGRGLPAPARLLPLHEHEIDQRLTEMHPSVNGPWQVP